MRRSIVLMAVLCFLFVSIPGFSQATNAQLTGVVTDQSGALIPGVTITMTKTDTGVVSTTVSNDAGVYTFQSLQPGSGYSVSAALPGFQTLTYRNLELSGAVVSRQNFQLQIATTTTSVEVSVDRAGALIESSSSVGDVLTRDRISNLPLVGNNVLDPFEHPARHSLQRHGRMDGRVREHNRRAGSELAERDPRRVAHAR